MKVEQYKKALAQLPEGWKLDYQAAAIWDRKEAVLRVELGDRWFAELSINTDKAEKNWSGEIVEPVKTRCALSLWRWSEDGKMASNTNGWLWHRDIEHPEAKTAQFKYTVAAAEQFTAADVLALFREHYHGDAVKLAS